MIELKALQKIVDRFTAVDIPSVEIKMREIAALVGSVDNGKDMLFQLLTGRMQPTTGSACLAGLDPYHERKALSRQVGM